MKKSCLALVALTSCLSVSPGFAQRALDQAQVTGALRMNLERVRPQLPPTEHSLSQHDIREAVKNLDLVVSFSQKSSPLSQRSLKNFQSLATAVDYIRKQRASRGNFEQSELVALKNITDDLQIKAESCKATWSDHWHGRGSELERGGLREIPLVVRTPSQKNTTTYVGGCVVWCVEAGWYGMPGQKDMQWRLSKPSTPSDQDTITPGLYYWWTVKNGVMLKSPELIGIKDKGRPIAQEKAEISVPAPPVP